MFRCPSVVMFRFPVVLLNTGQKFYNALATSYM